MFDGRGWTHYPAAGVLGDGRVTCLLEDQSGRIGAGTGSGLSFFDGERWQPAADGGPSGRRIMVLLEDRQHQIWAGTERDGVSRWSDGKWQTYGEADGLANNTVTSLVEDRDDRVWAGTDSGVSRFEGGHWKTYRKVNQVGDYRVSCLLGDRHGNLWVGTRSGGLSRLEDLSWRHFGPAEGLANGDIRVLMEDRNGVIWAGTRGGVANRSADGHWRFHTAAEGALRYPVSYLSMRLLVITSCTGEKNSSPANQVTLEDIARGGAHLKSREKELKDFAQPAGKIYTGQQHVRLMRGIGAVQEDKKLKIDLHILSAGYGMIPANREVVPYECTFATMKTKELRRWADQLAVPQGFRDTVKAKYALGLILLGDNYLEACALDERVKFGGPTLLFCGTGTAKSLPVMSNVRVVPVSNPEAKRFSCGLVALKGDLAARVLQGLAADPEMIERVLDPKFDLLAWLEKQGAHAKAQEAPKKDKPKKPSASYQPSATRSKGIANPTVDHVIQIPESWWDKPHRKKLRYFIPEWDDLVDPDYDFIADQHAGDNCGWENAVYAHQMYPEPNYDGLLMSRAVADKSKAKKERINAMGVHRMLRVPREFPIMGDCGAFDYIMEEVPPYTTEDVLDYYTRLDFDFGVSVDHLIVSATEEQKKFRYDLTIENAAEFFREHKKAGLKWQPIGAVQGWDPASYAKAAEKYVKMGYRYLGLGGLVRSSTTDILNIVIKVRERIPKDVSIHLFGSVLRPQFCDWATKVWRPSVGCDGQLAVWFVDRGLSRA